MILKYPMLMGRDHVAITLRWSSFVCFDAANKTKLQSLVGGLKRIYLG